MNKQTDTLAYRAIVIVFCPFLVFAQILVGFRYGRDDLDVLGLNFRRDLVDVSHTHCLLT